MKVLVTGSGGFLGRHLCQALKGRHELTAIDLRRPFSPGVLKQPWARQPFDVIIHLASMMCSKENARDPGLLFGNQQITKNVIDLALLLKPKHLIHVSSIAVYPNMDGTYREDSLVDPSGNGDGLYGLAKYNAEVLFNFYLGQLMTVTHLRPSQIYGPGMRPDRIFPAMIRELKEKNTVTIFGNGQRIANFVHVKDVVATISKVLRKPRPGVYNVGSQHHWTLAQWARKIMREYGNSRSKIIKVSKGSMVKQRINTDLIHHVFGIKNKIVDLKGIEI